MTREDILKKYSHEQDNLISLLHDLQERTDENYLSKEDLKCAADHLALPYTYVHGVATFYTMYSLEPRGKYVIRICQSPPCQLMGASTITEELLSILELKKVGETTEDKMFSVEMTSCLGVCGVAPAMMINNEVFGNLTKEKLVEIIEQKRRDA